MILLILILIWYFYKNTRSHHVAFLQTVFNQQTTNYHISRNGISSLFFPKFSFQQINFLGGMEKKQEIPWTYMSLITTASHNTTEEEYGLVYTGKCRDRCVFRWRSYLHMCLRSATLWLLEPTTVTSNIRKPTFAAGPLDTPYLLMV